MRYTALFGGTFDPPHLGHGMTITYALGLAEVDEVWVLPVADHPFGKRPAPFEARVAMCRLAFGLFGERVQVREDERDSSGRTWDLLQLLRARHPERRFRLVLGSDQRASLDRWYRAEELLEAAPPIWVGRRGQQDQDTDDVVIPDYSSTAARAALLRGERPRWLDHQVSELALTRRLYERAGDNG